MGSRYPRLIWAAPLMAALAVTLTASGPPASDGPAVRSISGRVDGGVSTVLIESSEPVAYLTSQPDPLTVFVDLRNARTELLDTGGLGAMQPPVSDVRLEPATAPDGGREERLRGQADLARGLGEGPARRGDQAHRGQGLGRQHLLGPGPVSYTHLTLPTN